MTERVLAVQRMQDYIEKNITEEISLSDLARASLFSPWYAYRLFRNCLGLTPTEYIRKYRLTQAAKQLRGGDVKVTHAAFDAGFSNVDTFTRAFYREFGLNPSDYMKNPVPVPFFIPYGAKYRKLRKENIDVSNIQSIFIQVVRKPERLCIIKRGKCAEDYFPYCNEVGCDVWGILMSMKSLCGESVSMWLPEKYKKPNTSTYEQGVEVETDYNYIRTELADGIKDGSCSCRGLPVTQNSKLKVEILERIMINGSVAGALIIPQCNPEITDAHKECLHLCAGGIAALRLNMNE